MLGAFNVARVLLSRPHYNIPLAVWAIYPMVGYIREGASSGGKLCYQQSLSVDEGIRVE